MKNCNKPAHGALTVIAALMTFALVLAAPGMAQQDLNERSRNQSRSDRNGFANNQNDDRGRTNLGQDRNRQLTLDDWVYVAYDYDDDGQYDAFEYIYTYDLERARKRSADQNRPQRNQQSAMNQDRSRQTAQNRSAFDRNRMNERTFRDNREVRRTNGQKARFDRNSIFRVSGTVDDIKYKRLAGMRDQHTIVKLNTDDRGVAVVDMGPRGNLSAIDLNRGDRVTAFAKRGTINQKTLLMAERVNAKGESITINRAVNSAIHPVKGTVVNQGKANFQNQNKDFLVANIRTENGRSAVAILGPYEDIRTLNLQSGDEILLLAQEGRMNNQDVLIAKEVRSGNRSRQVDSQRTSFRLQDQNRNQSQNRR